MSDTTTSAPARAQIDETAAQEQLHQMVKSIQTAILATANGEGQPDASYNPFVADENGDLYLYVSALARHTSNLRRGEPISLMLIEDESQAASLYARRRMTWQCTVEAVERDSEAFTARMGDFKARFGDIIDTLAGMTDFQLFRLHPVEGRLVLGFGAAFRVVGYEVQRQMHGKHRPSR